jgi:hypothetical protein
MTSPDGIIWTPQTGSASGLWYSVTHGNGLFVAVSHGTGVMTSPDGITWTAQTGVAGNQWMSVVFGNGLFVAVSQGTTGSPGNRVMTSPNGIAWTERLPAADTSWQSVAFGDGMFVAVSLGPDGRVMTSPDGISWTLQTPAAGNNWQSVTFGNGQFVAVSSSGVGNRVMTSRAVPDEEPPPAPVTTPAPAASHVSPSSQPTPAALNAQIRGLPLPAAAIALLEGELAGVLIDGEPVEVRILTAEEIIADAQALFGESSRLSLSPDSQLLNIANFDGTQSLEVNLADVKIIQIGSIRIALLSVGTSEGERGRDDDGKLVVQPDDQLVAVATGLPPLAAFRAFFFSTPTDLGTVVADGNGEVLLTAVLPAETAPGDHTLQLTTSTPEGGLVQIAIPVVIAEPVVEMVESEPETVVAEGEAADGSPVTPLLWVLIGGLVLVAIVTTVILVARSRRA